MIKLFFKESKAFFSNSWESRIERSIFSDGKWSEVRTMQSFDHMARALGDASRSRLIALTTLKRIEAWKMESGVVYQ